MELKQFFARLVVVPTALLLLGAVPASAPKFIPLGKYDEGLVIPVASPVRFQQFDQYDRAHFRGRFVVEGVFVLDCEYCEPGYEELRLSIVPDAAVAASLPHWKIHDNAIQIFVTDADPFIRSISTPEERKRLLSGKLNEIRGRAAIVVDNFEAGLDCDSANYSARFVAVAKAPRIANVELSGDYGCG